MSNLYFNHSYGLRNQTEILEIRAEFGAEGYGLYLMLLETIAESETQSINRNLVKGLSLNLCCDVENLKNLLDFCVKLNLFYSENDFIFSNHLKVHMEKRAEIKEKRAEAGKLGGKQKANASKALANAKQIVPKVKESKVNKSKVKENKSKVNNKLLAFDNFWNLYEKKGNRKKSLERFLKLDEQTIELILAKVRDYVLATPEIQYRKNGETYLNGECWNDQLPAKPKDKNLTPMQIQNSSINESWATKEEWKGLELVDGTFVIPPASAWKK